MCTKICTKYRWNYERRVWFSLCSSLAEIGLFARARSPRNVTLRAGRILARGGPACHLIPIESAGGAGIFSATHSSSEMRSSSSSRRLTYQGVCVHWPVLGKAPKTRSQYIHSSLFVWNCTQAHIRRFLSAPPPAKRTYKTHKWAVGPPFLHTFQKGGAQNTAGNLTRVLSHATCSTSFILWGFFLPCLHPDWFFASLSIIVDSLKKKTLSVSEWAPIHSVYFIYLLLNCIACGVFPSVCGRRYLFLARQPLKNYFGYFFHRKTLSGFIPIKSKWSEKKLL